LAERIKSGNLTLDDTRAEVWAAFYKRIMAAAALVGEPEGDEP